MADLVKVPIVRLKKVRKTPPASEDERLCIKTKCGARSKRPTAASGSPEDNYTGDSTRSTAVVKKKISKDKTNSCEIMGEIGQYFKKKAKDVSQKKSGPKQPSHGLYSSTQCPICKRSLQKRSFDGHMKLHSEDKMKYTCREKG